MASTMMISLQINHTSLPSRLSLGVAGRLFYLKTLKLVFTEFGGPIHQRPVEDLAFVVARFIQKGGSYVNYYM
ncbi:hypothetical protein HN51_050870, partial [Arachis hypogaea]